ncbi:MAG: SRPBCC family protein [Longimicrobiales bacterium]
MTHTLHRVQHVPTPLAETFDFFSRPENLDRITPPWLAFTMVSDDADMRAGLRIEYRIRPLGFPQKWVSEITAYDPPHRFVDEQVEGPYTRWHHEHTFRAVEGGTEVTDTVTYALPFGPLGRLAHFLVVGRQLESIFDYRRRRLRELLGGD